uniref:Transposase (Putative), gypsy type n=1 Tax=Tanacetum cinerariifolium TaxID=118510 RepID=A0A6L2MGZ8_TANCI|nr:hypothetical protein [Tanacetum cinerariifolium]
MSFSKRPWKNTPPILYQALGLSQKLEQPLFWVDERVFPTVVDWRTSAPKDGMPTENTYSAEAVRILDTHRTPIQKQPKMLLCLVGISRRYYLEDEVYPTFLHDDDWGGYFITYLVPSIRYKTDYCPLIADMDIFNLIRAPNPIKVKTRSRPRAAHKVPLLTVTTNRVIEMEDPTAATDSSDVPSTIERSPLDFANEAGASDQGTTASEVLPSEDVPTTKGAPEAGQAKEVTATDPSTVTKSRKRGHDEVDANAPPKVLRRDHADPRPAGSTRGGKSLVAIEMGMASTRSVPVPESALADVSDPDPLSFADPPSSHPADVAQSSQGTAAAGDSESENASFASAVGSSKSIYRPEWGVANCSMLDTPEACQDLVDHVAPPDYFSELRHLHNDDFLSRVEQRCAEMDARLDALSIDFDEELYPHMLTAIAGRRWMIGHGLRLAVMKCGESLELRQAFADVVSVGIAKDMSKGLRHRVEHGQAQLTLESIEAYDPEAETKYIAALQALKDLKYPLVDQLEGLKDAPMNVIMAALYLESDTGDDAPQWVRDLRPKMLLVDAIAANVSRAEKKKKCCIVCRAHGVGSAHHVRSDGVPVSAPTIVPQGLALLLADAATQTDTD